MGEDVGHESVDPAFFQDARARDGKMLAYQCGRIEKRTTNVKRDLLISFKTPALETAKCLPTRNSQKSLSLCIRHAAHRHKFSNK